MTVGLCALDYFFSVLTVVILIIGLRLHFLWWLVLLPLAMWVWEYVLS